MAGSALRGASDVLARICAAKRDHVEARKSAIGPADMDARAHAAPAPRGFLAQLRRISDSKGYALICEIKKASPSKGLIRDDFDPIALAKAYRDGGAACLSVLTDSPYFQGRDEDLAVARAAVDLPVLRKDFMIDPYQIAEARALGADCVLLIMAALSDPQAEELELAAQTWGMDVLIEVHDRGELERALRLRSPLIGINNRNLKTLEVDLEVTKKLASLVTPDRLLVSESGLRVRGDLMEMREAGARAFLIGESLMRQKDVCAAARALQPAANAAENGT